MVGDVGEKGPTGRRPRKRERAKAIHRKPVRFGEGEFVRTLWTKDETGMGKERNLAHRWKAGRAREVRKPTRAGGLGPN